MTTRAPQGRTRPGAADLQVGRPGVVWALPAALFFGLFALLPMVLVLVLSFTQWSGLGSPEFVGTENWSRLLDDPVMLKSIGLSLVLTALGVVTQTPVAMLLGVWAAGHQWNRAVLDPNFGVPAQMEWLFGDGNLFGNQSTAIAVLVFVSLWQFTPLHALIYQGAAKAVPPMLYEAAEIDGAGRVRSFFAITLPQLRNTMITSVILMVVGGLTTFDTVLILTNGGPGTDTTITAFYMYQKAFRGFDFGLASAIAVVLVVAATAISLVMVRLSGYDKMRSELEGV